MKIKTFSKKLVISIIVIALYVNIGHLINYWYSYIDYYPSSTIAKILSPTPQKILKKSYKVKNDLISKGMLIPFDWIEKFKEIPKLYNFPDYSKKNKVRMIILWPIFLLVYYLILIMIWIVFIIIKIWGFLCFLWHCLVFLFSGEILKTIGLIP